MSIPRAATSVQIRNLTSPFWGGERGEREVEEEARIESECEGGGGNFRISEIVEGREGHANQ